MLVLIFGTNIFDVRSYEVLSGGISVDKAYLDESVLGRNIFLINLKRIQREMETDPVVERVELRRVLPQKLSVEVQTREKAVLIEYMDGFIGVAADGYVLDYSLSRDEGTTSEGIQYLVVKGFEFSRFRVNDLIRTESYPVLENVIVLSDFMANYIEEKADCVKIENGRLILQMREDFLADFGKAEDPIGDKLEKFKLILEDLKNKGINRGIINMSYGKNPVYYPIQ